MKFKKVIAVGAATLVFMSMTLNVSAAKSSTDRYISRLKKSRQVSLILDVDAYRAAYSDLDKAFGNNRDAYIKHYLTAGVYEGRTKGVLFDPLTYAEGYDDIKEAFGDDILAIVNHYVTFGVKENRITGTAVGYEDMAAAIEDGAVRIAVRGGSSSAVSGSQASSGTSGSQVVQKPSESQAPSGASGSQTEQKPSESQEPSGASGSQTEQKPSESQEPSGSSGSQTEQKPSESQAPSGASGSQTEQKPSESQTPSGSSGSQTEQKPSESQAPSGTSGNQAENKFPGISIMRTTYIYADDNTLLRVEYYDENSKLIYYSDVVDYDRETKSYTEKIYSYDEDNNCDVLVRTDIYVNGKLSSTK